MNNKNKRGFYPDFKSDEIGYSVRPLDNKILIMIEIYKKDNIEESLDKMRICKDGIKNEILIQTGEDIEVNIVYANDILDQIDKQTNISNGVEVIDVLTGDFVPVGLTIEK